MHIYVKWAHGLPIKVVVEEFYPNGNHLLYQDQYVLKSSGYEREKVASLPIGMTEAFLRLWSPEMHRYLDRTLDEPSFSMFPENCFRGPQNEAQRALIHAISKYNDCSSSEVSPLVHVPSINGLWLTPHRESPPLETRWSCSCVPSSLRTHLIWMRKTRRWFFKGWKTIPRAAMVTLHPRDFWIGKSSMSLPISTGPFSTRNFISCKKASKHQKGSSGDPSLWACFH